MLAPAYHAIGYTLTALLLPAFLLVIVRPDKRPIDNDDDTIQLQHRINNMLQEWKVPPTFGQIHRVGNELRFIGDKGAGCEELDQLMSQTSEVTCGWTKCAHQFSTRVIKRPDYEGRQMKNCRKNHQRWIECKREVDNKMLKELLLMRLFQHPTIIKAEGYCIRNGVEAIMTCFQKPLTLLWLAQADWSTRFKIIKSTFDLIVYLDHVGVAMNDFRYQQFIFNESLNSVQLVDLDDIEEYSKHNELNTSLIKFRDFYLLPFLLPAVPVTLVGYGERILAIFNDTQSLDLDAAKNLFARIEANIK